MAAPAALASRPPVVHGVAARGRSRRRATGATVAAALGLAVVLLAGWSSVVAQLDLPGGPALAAGTVAALAGSYLCLVMLLLVSRLPWLERELGHDRMVRLHRRVAPYALVLVAAHVVLTTVSYAQAADGSVLGQLWTTVTRSAWMVPAATAFVLMVGLGISSYRRVRSRMAYETWWVAHLYFYLAVALAFGHQVAIGTTFVEHPVQRWVWTGLYLAVATAIVVARVLHPLAFSWRHRLHVVSVVPEATGVVSVYVGGRDLDLVRARGGQYFQWRFLTRHWWWQAHPYSLSAAPNPSWLRITVRATGDQSRSLAGLRPGTRVWAEGPYGVFTAAARHGERVTAVAAGVGITPVRAMLDDLPGGCEVTLVHRVSDAADAPLRAELDALAAARGWRVHHLAGPRTLHPVTPRLLTGLAPYVADSDLYVCGPDDFTAAVVSAARAAGVPPRRIHHESFSS